MKIFPSPLSLSLFSVSLAFLHPPPIFKKTEVIRRELRADVRTGTDATYNLLHSVL